MPKTVCQSVTWFKRYKTLKSVTVGSLNLRKFSYSARTRSAFGLARKNSSSAKIFRLRVRCILKWCTFSLRAQIKTSRAGRQKVEDLLGQSQSTRQDCHTYLLASPRILHYLSRPIFLQSRLKQCSFLHNAFQTSLILHLTHENMFKRTNSLCKNNKQRTLRKPTDQPPSADEKKIC